MIACDYCGKSCSDTHSDIKIEVYKWNWSSYVTYKTLHLHRRCYDTLVDTIDKKKTSEIPVEIKLPDMETKIREEVTELINKMTDRASKSHTFGDRECFDNFLNKADKIKDRLNLLWGE